MDETKTRVSKAGSNLFARIPDDARDKISRGDLVKITVIEKAIPPDDEKIRKIVKEFLRNPKKEKLTGTIEGYPVEIPFKKLITFVGTTDAEKFLCAIMRKE